MIKDGAFSSLRFLLKLRREHYDASINVHTQGRIHYRIVARVIGARLRLSHEYEGHGWLDRLLVNRTLPQDYTVHSIENNNRLLGLLGKTPRLASHEMELFLTPGEEDWAAQFLKKHGLTNARRLGLHVGSGGTKNLALKRWPIEHYIGLLKRLNASHPELAVLLFGGPEEEQAHERILQETAGQRVLVTRTQSLRQAAALLKHCDAFLSVDTALMHLASAVKARHQIVIEAPTLNPTNYPWHNPFRLIRNPVVNGRNLDYYRYDGKPIKGTTEELRRCMASIAVDEVYLAVYEALRRGVGR
jgi:heptosyltransferase-2